MFSKIVVLYEIYSKKLQWPDTFGTSLYIVKVILNNPKIILYNIAFSRGRAPNNPGWTEGGGGGGGGGNKKKIIITTYLIFSCLNVNKLSPSLVSISCTETCNKYSVTVIFFSIFHTGILPQFFKTFQTQFLFDFDEIFTNRMSEARTYVIFCDYF